MHFNFDDDNCCKKQLITVVMRRAYAALSKGVDVGCSVWISLMASLPTILHMRGGKPAKFLLTQRSFQYSQ